MDYISVSLLKAYDEDGGGGGEPTTPSWVLNDWVLWDNIFERPVFLEDPTISDGIYIYGYDIDSVVGTDVNWVVTDPINVSLGSNSSGTTTVTEGPFWNPSTFSYRIDEPVVCQGASPMSFTLTLKSGNQIGSGDVLAQRTYTKVVDYDFRLEQASSNMVGLWTFNFQPEAPAGSKNSLSVFYSSLVSKGVAYKVGLLGFDDTNPDEVLTSSGATLPSTCGFAVEYRLQPLDFSGLSLGDVIEIKLFFSGGGALIDTLTHTLGESYSNEYYS